jgi:hypothetical protein
MILASRIAPKLRQERIGTYQGQESLKWGSKETKKSEKNHNHPFERLECEKEELD